MARVGLIAGSGEFPLHVATAARAQGHWLCGIALKDHADPALADRVDHLEWLEVGQLSKLLQLCRRLELTQAVMAGQVTKGALLNPKGQTVTNQSTYTKDGSTVTRNGTTTAPSGKTATSNDTWTRSGNTVNHEGTTTGSDGGAASRQDSWARDGGTVTHSGNSTLSGSGMRSGARGGLRR